MHKLLIVGGASEMKDVLGGILRQSYNIKTVTNGKRGIDISKSFLPDLIISDIQIIPFDGFQLCQTIKADNILNHIPVILLTDNHEHTNLTKGLNAGADAIIIKPFVTIHLFAQINNLILTRQKLKEKYSGQSAQKFSRYNSDDNEFLQRCTSLVLENIDNQYFTVEILALKIAKSRPVLYRKLKALTNQSPQDFIRIIRLQEAKKLLKIGGKSISDTAYETGFADPKYFSTCFKKFYGCTPTQYSKKKL